MSNLLASVAAGPILAAPAVAAEPVPKSASAPSRLYGPDRYATALAISANYPTGVGVVYLATGENYPDALSAAPAAAKLGGPLLLTPKSSLPDSVRDEIRRLEPASVVVVGA